VLAITLLGGAAEAPGVKVDVTTDETVTTGTSPEDVDVDVNVIFAKHAAEPEMLEEAVKESEGGAVAVAVVEIDKVGAATEGAPVSIGTATSLFCV